MSTIARYYNIEDDDGDIVNFRYITRTCLCCDSCYDDTIEIQDEDGDWVGQNIESRDIKFLLRILIVDSANFEYEDIHYEP